MKSSDRTILIGLVVAGVFAAFWFLMLSPKKEEAAELGDRITQLESDVAAQKQVALTGKQAQAHYQRNFSSLVVLGKAAPTDGDTPGLLKQLVAISDEADARFELLQLGSAPAVESLPAAQATTGQAEAGNPSEGETAPPISTPVSAVPATEAAAASTPIGATVGSAGLGILPYDVKFTGDFFQIADLFGGIDAMVASRNADVEVGGRLITVNGFKMTKVKADSPLQVELSISSYVLPESQGLTAGGTSTMPPPSVPEATPVAEATP